MAPRLAVLVGADGCGICGVGVGRCWAEPPCVVGWGWGVPGPRLRELPPGLDFQGLPHPRFLVLGHLVEMEV